MRSMQERIKQGGIEEHVDSILADIVPDYLEHRLAEVNAIQAALENSDYLILREIGHDIEGTSGAFGFKGLAELGRALRLAAREQDDGEIQRISDSIRSYLLLVNVSYS